MSELLPLTEVRNAELAGKLRRLLIKCAAIYLLMIFIGDVLAASKWGYMNGMFMFLYLFGVLALPLSLTFWEGLVAAGFIAGQPGGEKGFNVKDGVDKVWKWAGVVIDKGLLYLVFWGVSPFFVLYHVDTTGYVLAALFMLPLIPPMVYFWVKWSPNTRTAFVIIGYAMTASFLLHLAVIGYNTVQRKMADPAAQVSMEHESKEEAAKRKNDLAVAQYIYGQIDRKIPLTPTEKTILAHLEKEKLEQSLKPRDLKTKVENFVGAAKPTEKAWWKQYWPLIGGVIIAIAIAWWMFGRTSNRVVVTATTGATVAVSATTAAKPGKKKWLMWLLLLALVGGLGYLYYTGELGYKKTLVFERSDLHEFKLCGVRPGTRTFAPVEPVIVRLWYTLSDGRTVYENSNISNFLMVNNTVSGEKFEVAENGCVVVSDTHPKGVRDTNRLVPQRIALTFQ
ncbi:MAG: hypothetical protein WA082_01525 [Candidatus Moraniibacteriota bacterium]